MSVSEYDTTLRVNHATHIFTCRSRSMTGRFTCWRTGRVRHTDLHVGVPTEYDIQIYMSAYRQSTTHRFTCWCTDRVRHTDLHVGVPTEYDTQIYMSAYRQNTTYRFTCRRTDRVRHTDLLICLAVQFIHLHSSLQYIRDTYFFTVTYTADVDPRERHSYVYRSTPECYIQIRVFYMSASKYNTYFIIYTSYLPASVYKL